LDSGLESGGFDGNTSGGFDRQVKKFKYLKMSKMSNFSYVQIIFSAHFADQGILNKDPTVWPDGARHANTCILPSF